MSDDQHTPAPDESRQVRPRIAIIGAGPIGLDVALAACDAGYPFVVYEAGPEAAHHVRRWGHVGLFSPWSMNLSERMRRAVRDGYGRELPAGDECPTGEELYDAALAHVASLPAIAASLRCHTRVVAVSREGLLKSDEIGTGKRRDRPFRLLVQDEQGAERTERADVVIDTSGVYGNPNPLGDGGIPAPGERSAEAAIVREIPDFRADDSWKGRRVLLVGGGHSAQTAAEGLARLFEESGNTVVWALKSDAGSFTVLDDDALPERARLAEAANRIVDSPPTGFSVLHGVVVDSISETDDGLAVDLRSRAGDVTRVVVDRILSLTGGVGDHTLYRQLHMHECWATTGPMKLAAALLGATSADCLTQESHGVDTLKNPEPDFFVLGAKSYGRNNTFLLRVGYDQVTEVFEEIARVWGTTPERVPEGSIG